jgi:site-specific recombinase XerD
MKYNKDLVKFNLKNSLNPNEKTQIFLVFNFEGNRLRYYTGKRIEPKFWDKVKQRAKPSYPSAVSLNQFLKTTANFLEDEFNQSQILGKKISIESLKDALAKRFDQETGYNVFEKFDEFIEVSKISRAATTIRKYKTTINQMKRFCNDKRINLTFDSFDLTFDERFKDFLINDLKLTNNTVAKHYKTLKVFLNWATEKGYNTSTEFNKLKAREIDGEIYFLDWDELMRLFYLEIESDKLKRVRDLFCFGCFTGLRFSDIINLKQENINNDTIVVNTLKTGTKAIIPLNKYSRIIYDRYKSADKYNLFQSISNQKMNTYLKELGKLAEINTPVQIIRYSGAERIERLVPKYEVLTSHVARKTFITNAMIKGMTTEVIMDITTHSSYKAFKRYFKIVDEQKRSQMNQAFN